MTTPTGGLVTFRLGEREYATPLGDVREVVRLQGLADLPGMRPPQVQDRQGGAPDDAGTEPGGPVGVAVDQVRAVLRADELPRAGAGADGGVLPPYVVDVLRGAHGVVFLVDLERMVASAREPAHA